MRVLLKDGRTVQGYIGRDVDNDGLLLLSPVTHAYDSDMNEILTTPLDAAIARNQVVDIEEVSEGGSAPAHPLSAPVLRGQSSEPEPIPIAIRTGAGGARDLSPRDDLAVGELRMRAAQTRGRGAHIGPALFVSAALALVALLLSSLSNNSDHSPTATSSPAPGQSSPPTAVGGAQDVAFLRDVSGVAQIHLLELSGGSPVQLFPSDTEQQRPDFSSTGDRLAYSAEVEGRQDIFVSRPDGTGAINVTNNDSDDYVPDFSPDGQSITFASNLIDDFDIYTLDLQGGEPRALIDNDAQETSPAWSPDGSTIAFASRMDGDFEIYTVSADGSESPVRVTDNSVDDRAPEWSPDGTALVYDRAVDGDTEIFVTPTGAEERQITDNGVEDRHPAWSPDGSGVFFGRETLDSSALYFKSLEPGFPIVLVDQSSGGFDPAVR